MKIHHPAWENAAKDGGMRYAFPPYARYADQRFEQFFFAFIHWLIQLFISFLGKL